MSYFNEDQQDYMRSLSAIPPEQNAGVVGIQLANATLAQRIKLTPTELRNRPRPKMSRNDL